MKQKIRFLGSFMLCAGLVAGIGCSGSSKGGNTPASSSSKAMSSFEIISPVAAAGVIDESAKTVAVTVPYGSSVTTLVANFETTGVKTTIGDVEQISSTTPNDFTNTSTQYPITKVSWRDAMVWCNALTEYYNANNGSGNDLAVVYCSDSGYTTPIRTSTSSTKITYTAAGTQDAPYVNASATGFRLPTSMEYEYAARYIGTSTSNTNVVLKDGVYYTNGASASGATATYTSDAATFAVAVFGFFDSGLSTGVTGTAVVKSKTANVLGFYDMNGNVWKLNFDWYPGCTGVFRVRRGGYFDSLAGYYMEVGNVGYNNPYYADGSVGFRFSRTK